MSSRTIAALSLAALALFCATSAPALAQSQGLIGSSFEMFGPQEAGCSNTSNCGYILGTNNAQGVIKVENVNCRFEVLPSTARIKEARFGPSVGSGSDLLKWANLPLGEPNVTDSANRAIYSINAPFSMFVGAGRFVRVTLSTFTQAQAISMTCSMTGAKVQ